MNICFAPTLFEVTECRAQSFLGISRESETSQSPQKLMRQFRKVLPELLLLDLSVADVAVDLLYWQICHWYLHRLLCKVSQERPLSLCMCVVAEWSAGACRESWGVWAVFQGRPVPPLLLGMCLYKSCHLSAFWILYFPDFQSIFWFVPVELKEDHMV